MIIGLYSTAPRSGKSEVAKVLCGELGFIAEAFAKPIKDMLGGVLARHGYRPETVTRLLYGDLKNLPLPEFGNTNARHLLETLGTRWGREMVHPDVWVHLLDRRMAWLQDNAHSVVIDDVRKPNEFRYLRDRGAMMIKVVRPRVPLDTASDEGRLEDPAYRWDHIITNDGTLGELRASVLALVGDLR